MAAAVENNWSKTLEGIAVTRYQHGLPTKHIEVIEAGHPVPDEAGETAARRILEETKRLGPDDLLLVLISGGGSSLLSLPAPGVTMSQMKALTTQLLRSGADIREMNTVRKHLSAIAGGRLAAASRAPVTALIISDVVGDDPTHIASGPCAPDPTTIDDAKAVLKKYRIDFQGPFSESPKTSQATNKVIATALRSLEAAGRVFENNGIKPVILGDTITGEAREVGREMAALARRTQGPAALISGGECTVTIQETKANEGGRGGRCAEFLLSLGIENPDVWAIAADTDGIDGSEDNAGAVWSPALGKRPGARQALDRHDSYGFFKDAGALIVTGPTRTNVNDYRAIIVA
jgi:hydroxypyruvate reductase